MYTRLVTSHYGVHDSEKVRRELVVGPLQLLQVRDAVPYVWIRFVVVVGFSGPSFRDEGWMRMDGWMDGGG